MAAKALLLLEEFYDRGPHVLLLGDVFRNFFDGLAVTDDRSRVFAVMNGVGLGGLGDGFAMGNDRSLALVLLLAECVFDHFIICYYLCRKPVFMSDCLPGSNNKHRDQMTIYFWSF